MEVFKQKKSKFWWYDFAVRGKRFRRSTGETNKNRAEKIASLKFAEICEHGDPLPRKAPTVLEVSKRFLESVDDSRLVENSKLYYHRGWRLLSKTPVTGLRLDLVTNEVAGTLRFGGSPANTNCALRTLRRTAAQSRGLEADSESAEDQVRQRAGAQLAFGRNCRSETVGSCCSLQVEEQENPGAVYPSLDLGPGYRNAQ